MIYGIALSTKQVALLFLPLLILGLIYLNNVNSLKYLLASLFSYLLLAAPSIILGRNVYSALLSPFLSESITGILQANFTNFYSLYTIGPLWYNWNETHWTISIGNMLFMGWFLFISLRVMLALYNNKKTNAEHFLIIIVWLYLFVCCFKCGIHDRYLMFADVMSVVWFMVSAQRFKKISLFSCCFIQFISIFNIMNYLIGISENISNVRLTIVQMVSVSFVAFVLYFTYRMLVVIDNDVVS